MVQKTILIDCRTFTKKLAGTAGFLSMAIRLLEKKRPDVKLILLSPKPFNPNLSPFKGDNTHILIKPLSLFGIKLPNIVWFLFYLPYMLFKFKPDYLFEPSPTLPLLIPKYTKKIIIVHDVVNIEWANTMEFKNRAQNLLFFSRSIKQADYIWTNSHYTAKKTIEYYPKRKSINLYTGLSVNTSKFSKMIIDGSDISLVKKKYHLRNKFILFVGTLEPRKNLQFLLRIAPEIIKRTSKQLLIVGARGWKNSHLFDIVSQNKVLFENVIFAGYVPDEDLVKLYNIADCFVSTSLNEGFGMPQLEALLCGCPVVCPDNSAMTEVVGGRGVTIKGWSEQIWVNEICRVLSIPKDSFSPQKMDLSPYNWDNIIDGFIKYINL